MKRQTLSHGLSYAPEYRAWQTMRLRCTVPTNAAYPSYGGRGITVCDRWLNDPATFLADMGPKPSPKHELDRIDNDKGYSPENCRWATRKENDRNRRSNRLVTLGGETLTVAAWAERLGVRYSTMLYRLEAGWSESQLLNTSVRPMARKGEPPVRAKPCLGGCGALVVRDRCQPCENKTRHQRRREAAANYTQPQLQHRRAA